MGSMTRPMEGQQLKHSGNGSHSHLAMAARLPLPLLPATLAAACATEGNVAASATAPAHTTSVRARPGPSRCCGAAAAVAETPGCSSWPCTQRGGGEAARAGAPCNVCLRRAAASGAGNGRRGRAVPKGACDDSLPDADIIWARCTANEAACSFADVGVGALQRRGLCGSCRGCACVDALEEGRDRAPPSQLTPAGREVAQASQFGPNARSAAIWCCPGAF